MQDASRSEIKQRVEGNGNQVAGRDIIIGRDAYAPDPNNPHLTSCHACGYPGMSRGAELCPRCGHNHLADQIAAATAASDRRAIFWALVLVGLIFSVQLALWVETATGWGFLDSYVAAALGTLLALWAGLYGFAYARAWWESHTRRGSKRA